MSLWSLLEGGISYPMNQTLGQRISNWFGYKFATRHRNVAIHKSCLISPEARINPRSGSIKIDEHSIISMGAVIQGNIKIGKHCSVQPYSILVGYSCTDDQTGLVSIGDYVRIASHVMIVAGNHVFEDPDKPIHNQGMEFSPVIIEDDVWIAGRVNIMAGVRIGQGSVIGAGSVVTKDIPPYSIAVGVPAKVIQNRQKNSIHIQK